MLLADGWFDWVVRDPGPVDRWAAFNNGRTTMQAIYHHSLEGWFYPVNSNGHNEMKNPDRFPTAWHWTNVRRVTPFNGINYPPGTIFQHYPVFARLQHGNGGNILGPGGETEGIFTMPLLPEQVASWLRIHEDIRAFTGKPFIRVKGDGRFGLCEHREAPGAQTACPSERYTPLWAAVAQGGTMAWTAEETKRVEKIENRLYQLETQSWGENPRTPRGTPDAPYYESTWATVDAHIKSHGGSGNAEGSHTHTPDEIPHTHGDAQ